MPVYEEKHKGAKTYQHTLELKLLHVHVQNSRRSKFLGLHFLLLRSLLIGSPALDPTCSFAGLWRGLILIDIQKLKGALGSQFDLLVDHIYSGTSKKAFTSIKLHVFFKFLNLLKLHISYQDRFYHHLASVLFIQYGAGNCKIFLLAKGFFFYNFSITLTIIDRQLELPLNETVWLYQL